jgi:hypothetical protein
MYAVHHDVVGSELRCGETACDTDTVIVAPQSEVMIEAENEQGCAALFGRSRGAE